MRRKAFNLILATSSALLAAAVGCATTQSQPMPSSESTIGTASGAQARALIYAGGVGLLSGPDAAAVNAAGFGVSSLKEESDADPGVIARATAALAPGLCGPVDIVLEDRLTQLPLFQLVELSLMLDDTPIALLPDVEARDALRYLIFHGNVAPGSHVLLVKLTYRGGGSAEGYTWRLRDRVAIQCNLGQTAASVRVVAFPQDTPEWAEAPRITFEGAFVALKEPGPLTVKNELAATLAALRVDAATGRLPSAAASSLEEMASRTSPLNEHALTPEEAETLHQLRESVRHPTCTLKIELDDRLSDETFDLGSVRIAVDGVPVLDEQTYDLPTVPQHREFLVLHGPVATGKHEISAELQVRGGDPARKQKWMLKASPTVDCKEAVDVSFSALRCMNRPEAQQPELRVSIDRTYRSTGCEER